MTMWMLAGPHNALVSCRMQRKQNESCLIVVLSFLVNFGALSSVVCDKHEQE